MMDKSRVSILLPTCHRPDRLRRALVSIRITASDAWTVVAIDPDDSSAFRIASEFDNIIVCQCPTERGGAHAAWNVALVNAPANAQAFVLGADDAVFRPGWLEIALSKLREIGGCGVVGLNDDKPRPTETPAQMAIRKRKLYWATHFLMSRDFLIQHNGGVMAIPCYRSDWTDVETCDRAIRAGLYIYAENAHVSHEWGGPSGDETYRRSDAFRPAMEALYKQRKAKGFPNDFSPILTE